MTDQKAITKAPSSLKNVLAFPAVVSRFESILGKRGAASFIGAILNAAATNKKISECEPISVVNSALQIATLGLDPSPSLGQAAIVPFNGKDGMKASCMVMARGLIQLAHQTGKYNLINVAPVYEGEEWEENRLTGQMTLKGRALSKNVIGYVAYFRLVNGFEKYLAMTIEEILEHAHKYSKSYNKRDGSFYPGSYWLDHPEVMYKKTVLRALLLGYGPLSPGMRKAAEAEGENGDGADVTITAEDLTNAKPAEVQPAPEPMTEDEIMADLGYS